jgi:hypothetical protein
MGQYLMRPHNQVDHTAWHCLSAVGKCVGNFQWVGVIILPPLGSLYISLSPLSSGTSDLFSTPSASAPWHRACSKI